MSIAHNSCSYYNSKPAVPLLSITDPVLWLILSLFFAQIAWQQDNRNLRKDFKVPLFCLSACWTSNTCPEEERRNETLTNTQHNETIKDVLNGKGNSKSYKYLLAIKWRYYFVPKWECSISKRTSILLEGYCATKNFDKRVSINVANKKLTKRATILSISH